MNKTSVKFLFFLISLFIVSSLGSFLFTFFDIQSTIFWPRSTQQTTPKQERQNVASLKKSTESDLTLIKPDVQQNPAAQKTPIKLLFAGDMMFDRHIRAKAMGNNGYDFIFSEIQSYLSEFDLVIANLEGPVTGNQSVSINSVVGERNNFIFTFSPEIIPTLQKHNFKLLNLGNNHSLDFGVVGAKSTVSYLKDSKIDFFGNIGVVDDDYPQRWKLVEIDKTNLAFVNFNQFVAGGFEAALLDIEQVSKKADLVVVYTHWGNEYQPTANKTITNWAQQLIAAGADLIIGSHPHVIQNKELVDNVQVYYSLGNFVFDQYFSPEVMQGLLVEVNIEPSTLEMDFDDKLVSIGKDGVVRLIKYSF